MRNPNTSLLRNSARFTALLAALFTLGSAHAQCCGRQAARPGGAFELSGGNVAVGLPDGSLNRLHLDMAWFGATRSPFKKGIRIGLASLGTSNMPVEDVDLSTPDAVDEHIYRLLLPELSGVLRFDPLRGGFRPFLEGELGIAAAVVDQRSFDVTGERTGYRINDLDPTVSMGWSAGTRVRLGRAAFLVLRYGEQQGGVLPYHDLHSLDTEAGDMGERRRQATIGFSFGR